MLDKFLSENASNVSALTEPGKFEYATITSHFGREILLSRSIYCDGISFEKLRFQLFFVHNKTQNGRFEFLWFEERFRKGAFSCRISVDGRQNRRIRAAFLSFFSILSTLPN